MADQQITIPDLGSLTAGQASDLLLATRGTTGYKMLLSDLAKYMVETYNSSSLAGSAQSVKNALDSLNSRLTWSFNNTELITSQAESLPINKTMYFGTISSYNHQTETGAPENSNGYVEVSKWGSTYISIKFYGINGGLVGNVYVRNKNGSTWSDWVKQPTREEVDTHMAKITTINNTNSLYTKTFSADEYCVIFVTLNNDFNVYYAFSTNGSNCVLMKIHENISSISASVSGSTLSITNTASSNARLVFKRL